MLHLFIICCIICKLQKQEILAEQTKESNPTSVAFWPRMVFTKELFDLTNPPMWKIGNWQEEKGNDGSSGQYAVSSIVLDQKLTV